MSFDQLLYSLFVLPPDIGVMKLLIFLLVLSFLMIIVPNIRIFKENPRTGRIIAILITLIAVLGMGNNYIVGILTGYSWAIIVLFILLPIVGLIFLLTLKGDTVSVSLLKMMATGVILFALSSFRGMIQDYNAGFLNIGQGSGMSLDSIFGVVLFAVMMMFFYYIFELFSRLIFRGNASTNSR